MKRTALVPVVLIWSLILTAGCGGPRRALMDESTQLYPRPSHYGLSLPYPVSEVPFVADTSLKAGQAERLIPLSLQIDSEGRVVGITSGSPDNSRYVSYYAPYLESLRFKPGLREGVPAAMTLPIDLQVGAVGSEPIVRFPVGPNRAVTRPDLYWQAFAEHGIETPSLISFPSYDYRFGDSQRWRRYPIKIYKVDLDTAGQVTATELVQANAPEYNDQIESAILWGRYSPLRLDGRAVASTSYLVVSLYPTMKYPSRPLGDGVTEGATIWDKSRVRLFPDTIGLLAGPIPKRDWSGEIVAISHQGMIDDLVTARIAVDTMGASRLTDFSTEFYRARTILNMRSHNLRFFPAVDYSGITQPYDGLVYLRYLSESNVRIWFDWLGDFDPGLNPQDTTGQ